MWNLAISARIELSSGTVIIENPVDGKIPYGEFFKNTQLKYASEGRIERITFLDVEQRAFEDETSSERADNQNHREQTEQSDREYIVAPMIDYPLARTLWDVPPKGCTSSLSYTDRTVPGKKSDDLSKASPSSKRTWSSAASIFQKSGKSCRS